MLGAHSVLGVGMSPEKIEELLRTMNETRVEVTIPSDEKEKFPPDSSGNA